MSIGPLSSWPPVNRFDPTAATTAGVRRQRTPGEDTTPGSASRPVPAQPAAGSASAEAVAETSGPGEPAISSYIQDLVDGYVGKWNPFVGQLDKAMRYLRATPPAGGLDVEA